jgi:formylglycine-generating enzyme required for sulfatase activity
MQAKICSLFIALALISAVLPAPAQPTLGIAPTGGQSVLYWPTNAGNYILQSSTNLASQNWLSFSNAVPLTVNSNLTVTVTNSSRAMFFRLYLDTNTPSGLGGMILIPAGVFTLGDTLDGESDAIPTNVTVSAFYMDSNLVSYAQWQLVYNWATNNGYGFINAGAGKAATHPVQSIDWYDCVKWCNARSQQAGFTPIYYADAGFTQLYTNGETTGVFANWTNSGFRLPTEAEWEEAARGGLNSLRFPWGNTIDWSQANYFSYWFNGTNYFFYDLAPTNGYAPAFNDGVFPYTSPVGSFAANGYGLYDMAGNVQEWCWDWYDYNVGAAGSPYAGGTDPRGPAASPFGTRVSRGGSWDDLDEAKLARCAQRINHSPFLGPNNFGLRCVQTP